MNPQSHVKLLCVTFGLASLLAVKAAFAEDSAAPAETTARKATPDDNAAKQNTPHRAVKFDADLDDDGIINAVTSLTSVRSTSSGSKPADPAQKDFSATFQDQRNRPRQTRNSCMDYMMLSPEDKDRVNQRVQSRTQGQFGTRPCDPFVSPLLERPFDDEYIEIPLKPVGSVVVR